MKIDFGSTFRIAMARLGYDQLTITRVLDVLSQRDQHLNMKSGSMTAYAYFLSGEEEPMDVGHLRRLERRINRENVKFVGATTGAKDNRIGLYRYIRYLEALSASRPKMTE